jgi:hypothetical protein
MDNEAGGLYKLPLIHLDKPHITDLPASTKKNILINLVISNHARIFEYKLTRI